MKTDRLQGIIVGANQPLKIDDIRRRISIQGSKSWAKPTQPRKPEPGAIITPSEVTIAVEEEINPVISDLINRLGINL